MATTLPPHLLTPLSTTPFPTFNWPALTAHIHSTDPQNQPPLWQAATTAWAHTLCDSFNTFLTPAPKSRARYQVSTSPNFRVITSRPDGKSDRWPLFAEFIFPRLLKFLTPIAKPPAHPLLLCFPHDIRTFDAYLQTFGVRHLTPGGVYIIAKTSIPHIVICPTMHPIVLRCTLLHELTHALIHHLEIPHWLEEGICQRLQSLDLDSDRVIPATALADPLHRYWKTHNLHTFWNGKAFAGEPSDDAYALAFRLTRRLLGEGHAPFLHFCQHARRPDAGNAACLATYHQPLLTFLTPLLGPGNWAEPPSTPLVNPPEFSPQETS